MNNRYDPTIEALYQVLPAESLKDIVNRLRDYGIFLTRDQFQAALHYLRKHPELYVYTVPYAGTPGPHRFYAAIIEKDGFFHTDPGYKSSLTCGSKRSSQSIITYTTHVGRGLRTAACATHIPRSLRDDFAYYADKYDQIARDIKRLYRKLDEFDTDEGNAADGTHGA